MGRDELDDITPPGDELDLGDGDDTFGEDSETEEVFGDDDF